LIKRLKTIPEFFAEKLLLETKALNSSYAALLRLRIDRHSPKRIIAVPSPTKTTRRTIALPLVLELAIFFAIDVS
jgi:hypothetical protein